MPKIKDALVSFVKKYSWEVHLFFAVWNSFVVSWATGTSVPLDFVGMPFSLNARAVVVAFQSHTHTPTWLIGTFSFLINITIMYLNWKKNHPDQNSKDVIPPVQQNLFPLSAKVQDGK